MTNDLNASLFSTHEMSRIFSSSQQLRAMMRFEWALTCALEAQGIAEAGSGGALESNLDAGFVDVESLQRESLAAGNIAIPFVRQLTAKVKEKNESASHAIHLGATSQDVLDTALVLQIRDAMKLIVGGIDRMEHALAKQVRAHAGTVMTGRTWLQPGPPTTLGLKLAGTLAALCRHRARIREAAERALVVQFGGAVGTLAALGSAGAAVSTEVARILGLKEPSLPWHTQRDNIVEIAQVLALLVGTLGKFAMDIALLMQAEVGEVSEPARAGRGGSSTMPHKRNPVACAAVLAVAARVPGLLGTMLTAMPQQHERGLGLWQAEWETLPDVFRLSAAALDRSAEIAEGLTVDAERMRANFDATQAMPLSEAVVAALALKIGRDKAHGILEKAILQAEIGKQLLSTVLKMMPEITVHLNDIEIDRLLQPDEYLGSAQRFIERVLGDFDADC